VEIERIELSSPAWISGLRRGDIIHAINGVNIRSVNDFVRTVTRFKGQLQVTVRRGRQVALITIQ